MNLKTNEQTALPFDIARCRGIAHDGEWRDGCEDCLRRTAPPDPSGRQEYTQAPTLIAFECPLGIWDVWP